MEGTQKEHGHKFGLETSDQSGNRMKQGLDRMTCMKTMNNSFKNLTEKKHTQTSTT